MKAHRSFSFSLANVPVDFFGAVAAAAAALALAAKDPVRNNASKMTWSPFSIVTSTLSVESIKSMAATPGDEAVEECTDAELKGAVPYGPPMTKALKSAESGEKAFGQDWNVVFPLLTGEPVLAKEEKDPLYGADNSFARGPLSAGGGISSSKKYGTSDRWLTPSGIPH